MTMVKKDAMGRIRAVRVPGGTGPLTPSHPGRRGDPATATTCEAFHGAVLVRQSQPREVLTAEQARRLAADLVEAAELADRPVPAGRS